MEFTSCKLGWEECGGGAGAAGNNIIIIIISHLIEFYSYDIYHPRTWPRENYFSGRDTVVPSTRNWLIYTYFCT